MDRGRVVIECAGVRGFKQGGGVGSQPETKALRDGAGAGVGWQETAVTQTEKGPGQAKGGRERQAGLWNVCVCVYVSGSVSVCLCVRVWCCSLPGLRLTSSCFYLPLVSSLGCLGSRTSPQTI